MGTTQLLDQVFALQQKHAQIGSLLGLNSTLHLLGLPRSLPDATGRLAVTPALTCPSTRSPVQRLTRGGWITRMALPQPDDLTSLVLRIDFSSDSAWEAVRAAIDGLDEYRNATYVSDPPFAGVSVEALVTADADAEDDDNDITMTDDEHPLLAVDLYDEPGRTFRVPPRWFADVSNNLSIANMDFAEFADAVDASGTYRGFESAP